jgi:hypothetical protein
MASYRSYSVTGPKMGGCAGEQDWCVPQPLEDGDLARQEGVTSGEREETTMTLDSLPTQEIGSNAVRGAVGATLRTDRCPCGVGAYEPFDMGNSS